ncbi:hypothetical protein Tco_0177872, partial [Tanacetum coccineum]
EDLSPLAVEGLHQPNFYCFNVYVVFSSNLSFRDFTARITGEGPIANIFYIQILHAMVLTGWKIRKKWTKTTWRLIEELESAYENAPNMFSIRIHFSGIFYKYLGRRYVDGQVDIFDMVDIELFNVIVLNKMFLQLGYTVEFEPLFYNYIGPLSSLDEELYPLVVKAIIEDISQPSTSATKENKYNKLLLLTWHDSTPAKDSVCNSVTPRCMPHGLLTPPTNESVITYTQLSSVQGLDTQDHVIDDVMRRLSFNEIELDEEAGFGDVAGSSMDSFGLSHDESFGVDDLD